MRGFRINRNSSDRQGSGAALSATGDITGVAEFAEIPVPMSDAPCTASSVQYGKQLQPQQHILLYSPDEWEIFIQEWVHAQRAKYKQVLRFAGANDMGVDVAGFLDDDGLMGVWHNFQCKHYGDPLTPSTAAGEVAKILWYSFNGQYKPPSAYAFVAPRECGMALKKLLMKPDSLKKYVTDNWERQCANAVTKKQTIVLQGAFAAYVDAFDFSVFGMRTTLEIVDDHRATPYHAVRFGGGLKERPKAPPAPAAVEPSESRYVAQLYEAYGDHLKVPVSSLGDLATRSELVDNFHRQREFFYHAESLRNFARDTVPEGTFEDLQTEIHSGVIDVEAAPHADGFVRMSQVMQAATALQLTANPLITRLYTQDRKGICHQLANEDRLRWRKP
jgi:hypothetical protein